MSEDNMITEEILEHISKLALLNLTDEERVKFGNQLNEILKYFSKLNDLDTSKINPMTHPIEGLKNVFREDIPRKSLSKEDALKNAQHTKDGFFKAPKILKD
jgi:aspartyl-tRNA(Asn)/glutamyl-tRNA(Gln) amidotransferase subunit C